MNRSALSSIFATVVLLTIAPASARSQTQPVSSGGGVVVQLEPEAAQVTRPWNLFERFRGPMAWSLRPGSPAVAMTRWQIGLTPTRATGRALVRRDRVRHP